MTVARPIRIGMLAWTQHTTWAELMRIGALADQLGYDHCWVWDHLLPLRGRPSGPIFEAFTTLAGWAAVTSRARLGPLVVANTFRNPALVVKMITALDHMTGGRAILGLGAAGYDLDNRAFGFDYGTVGERLDRFDEAAQLILDMLRGRVASARGPYYSAVDVVNDPPPVQAVLPLVIGGAGERKTLATVARYADAWNVGGDFATVRHKDEVFREWCTRIGRDEAEVERITGLPVVIRDDRAAARRVLRGMGTHNGGWHESIPVGPSDAIVEYLAPFVELGFRTIILDLPTPFDQETLERFIGEVKPGLEAVAGTRA